MAAEPVRLSDCLMKTRFSSAFCASFHCVTYVTGDNFKSLHNLKDSLPWRNTWLHTTVWLCLQVVLRFNTVVESWKFLITRSFLTLKATVPAAISGLPPSVSSTAQ